MYTFEQLKEDVRKEAEALRVHATKEERERLNLNRLDPGDGDHCIYGMVANYCHSKRAVELIIKCTPRYFKSAGRFTDIKKEGFTGIVSRVNGETVEDLMDERCERMSAEIHFSAIEAYILLPEAQNANLISYLRGETETLTL